MRLEKEGAVGVLVLDRPPVNSYDAGFARDLGRAIDELRLDEEVGAVVLRSASDKFFSTGADVAEFEAGTPRRRWMTVLLMHEALRKMESTPLIFVAAITGHALGGGLEIALACDLRFGSEGDHRLGLPEVSLGLFPANGGTQRLPRLVGRSRGLDMIVRGCTVTPDEAGQMGILDRLLKTPELCLEEAMAYAREAAEGPREAIGRAKITAALGYDLTLDAGNALEREAIGRVFASEDAREGIRAFLEKRQPRFHGR